MIVSNYHYHLTPKVSKVLKFKTIVAVGHDEFKKITQEQYEGLSKGDPIVIDVKGIVDNPTWRL